MRELQLKFITNTITERWMRILNVIEQQNMFTIVGLSQQLGVSKRTILKDVSELKNYFEESAIFESNTTGYFFKEKNRRLYHEEKEALLQSEIWFEIISDIFYGELVSIEELADRYNYSESTMLRSVAQINEALKEYQLSLSLKPVDLVGKEGNIRKFFFDFFYEGEPTPYTVYPPESIHQMFLAKLGERLGKYKLGTGIMVNAFYYFLYISMIRNQQGHIISIPQSIKEIDISDAEDFLLLSELVPLIEKKYGISMHPDEVIWLFFVIVSKRPIDRVEQEAFFFDQYNQWTEIIEVVESYFRVFGINVENNSVLPIFLKSFFLGRRINNEISPILNKLLSEENRIIQDLYKATYEKNKQFILRNQKKFSFSEDYLSDIVASLTMYTEILFTYYSPKKTVLFLLEGNHLLVQWIQVQASQLLSKQHHVLFVPLHELTEERLNLEHVDLIVTNYRPYMLDYQLHKEYVLINRVPDINDWGNIFSSLNSLFDHMF
ncbi:MULTISPECIES: helix-turn-helix domain-containing protein [Enterococcus]|nr:MULTISPECIES: helix-turn-helix domain-containing protein [unclassified Enterococcus]MBO0462089.1 helix-turn-helix domain-containing protein [Enterococcus sp. DIV1298c]MBO0489625.1 helix-turn-helix domain-containing protein [Enterococcus sp. DIV1094]MBO1298443.1 helix-turn-helix domain-containing protein [Enterococcus sp. DIV1271a]